MVEYCPADIASIPMYYRINSLRILAPGIAASHWDGTYRDRMAMSSGFWDGEPTWPYQIATARHLAKHLY